MTSENTNKNIMDSLGIFFIKKISNCFWELADNWSYTNDKIASYYDRSIGKEYRKEYNTCAVSPNATILHIGCGAYPLTEMVLADFTKGSIIGIDKNPRTVQRAKQVIQRKKLSDHVKIQDGNGLDFPVDSFDVIIVSSCSLPKLQILQHLFQKAKTGSFIVVREVDIVSPDIVTSIHAHTDIVVEQQIRHNPFPFFEPVGWTTFCLRKK